MTGVALTAAVATAPAAVASTPTPADTTAAVSPAKTTTVTLVTGDVVSVQSSPTGQTRYTVTKNVSGGYSTLRNPDGDEYVIPVTARPYLGRELDMSLFDVTAMIRVGAVNGAAVPVSLSYAAGVTPVAPAGVTIDATSGSTATGTVTPASAQAFTSGLRQRIGADVAAGRSAGASAPVPGLTEMRLTGGAAPLTASPHLPLNLLQVNLTGLTGAPADDANLVLVNVDSLNRVATEVPINSGVGRVEVPAGNYSAVAQYEDFDQDGNLTAFREVVKPDFTLQAGTANAPLNFVETDATVPVTVSTPRPAEEQDASMDYNRTDSTGQSTDAGVTVSAPTQLLINTVPAATVGGSRFVVTWEGSATDPSDAYAYSVEFASTDGVAADQNHVVRPDQLATVHQRLSTDPAATGTGFTFDTPTDPVVEEPSLVLQTAMPQELTHYYGTADGSVWGQSVVTPEGTNLSGSQVTLVSGHQYTQDWGHGPITPGLTQFTDTFNICGACATGDDVDLELNSDQDSTPGHSGFFGAVAASDHLTVYRDGTQVLDTAGNIADLTGVPQQAGTYRAVLDEDYTGVPGHSQALTTHTDLTVAYDPAATAEPLPADQLCAIGDDLVLGTCQILPELTLNYQFATDLTNTTSSPVQRLRLIVGHVSYEGVGAQIPIRSATVAVSYDGGHHWLSVPVTGRSGSYAAAWPNPSKGNAPELKVTARDADGNTISQTVSDPYTIGSGK